MTEGIKSLSEEEIEKIFDEAIKENNLTDEEINNIASLLDTSGGKLSQGIRRSLIGIGGALGAAALAGIGTCAIKYMKNKKIEKAYEENHLENVAKALSPEFKDNLARKLAQVLKDAINTKF